MEAPKTKAVSIIVPCFNEEEVLPEFFARSVEAAKGLESRHPGWTHEWIFVNDCSTDRTSNILAAIAVNDSRVKVIDLARNRGHQVAVTAGLDFAHGDAVVIIDADLQDPPEVIERMLTLIDEGYDIVHAQRTQRPGETVFKLWTAKMFYTMLRRIGDVKVVENAGDFRCVSRPVAETMRAFREPHRFLRGMFTHLGFEQCILQYDRDVRHAGESKYPFLKMLKLAADAVFSMSSAPIRSILWAAGLTWGLGFAYLVYSLVIFFTVGIKEPGWTSAVFLLTMYTGLILMSIAVIGQYVGRVFEQGQGRPLYWVARTHNIDDAAFDGLHAEVKLARSTTASARATQAVESLAEPKVFVAKRPENGWASAALAGEGSQA
jgi:dolichol-phosphate mannosyltransferase